MNTRYRANSGSPTPPPSAQKDKARRNVGDLPGPKAPRDRVRRTVRGSAMVGQQDTDSLRGFGCPLPAATPGPWTDAHSFGRPFPEIQTRRHSMRGRQPRCGQGREHAKASGFGPLLTVARHDRPFVVLAITGSRFRLSCHQAWMNEPVRTMGSGQPLLRIRAFHGLGGPSGPRLPARCARGLGSPRPRSASPALAPSGRSCAPGITRESTFCVRPPPSPEERPTCCWPTERGAFADQSQATASFSGVSGISGISG